MTLSAIDEVPVRANQERARLLHLSCKWSFLFESETFKCWESDVRSSLSTGFVLTVVKTQGEEEQTIAPPLGQSLILFPVSSSTANVSSSGKKKHSALC